MLQVLAIMAQAPWPRLPLRVDGVLRVQLSLQVPPHNTSTHVTSSVRHNFHYPIQFLCHTANATVILTREQHRYRLTQRYPFDNE